jgi:hypothetical protein
MAGGTQPVLNLTGACGSSGGLLVSGDTGSATGGGFAAIGNTVGTTAVGISTQPALLVKFT